MKQPNFLLTFATLAIGLLASPFHAFAIQHGREVKDETRWNQVVGFGEMNPGSTDDSLFCSGVLVHPRIILTAAHCVFRKPGMNEKTWARQVRVYMGLGSSGSVLAKNLIAEVRVHEDYLRSPNGWSDYAYVILKKPVTLPAAKGPAVDPQSPQFNPFVHANTSGILPIMMDQDDLDATLDVDTKLRKFTAAVGFGVDQTGLSGIKREGFLELEKYDSWAEVYTKANPQDADQTKPPLLMDRRVTGLDIPVSFIGGGDSGGPIFALNSKKEWAVLALVSRSTEKPDGHPYFGLSSARNGACWVHNDLKVVTKITGYEDLTLNLDAQGKLTCEQSDRIKSSQFTLQLIAKTLKQTSVNGITTALKTLAQTRGTLDLSNKYMQNIAVLGELLGRIGPALDTNPLKINLRRNRIQTLNPLASLLNKKRIIVDIQDNDISAKEAELLFAYKNNVKGIRFQVEMLVDTPFKAMCDCSTQKFTSSVRPKASDRECGKQAIARMAQTAKDIGLPFDPTPDFAEEPPRASFPLMARERELTISTLFDYFFPEQREKEVSCQSLNSELIRRKRLILEFPALSDFTPLTGFADLRSLSIQGQKPLNWNFLKDLRLNDLNASGTLMTDLSVIEDMVSLRQLWVESNSLTSIAPIVRLIEKQIQFYGVQRVRESGLQKLCIHDNEIKDIQLLAPFLKAKILKQVSMDKSCARNKSPFGL